MEMMSSLLVVTTSLLVRLAVPILLTAILIFCLRRLDARWQKEAQSPELVNPKVEYWMIKGCPPAHVANCVGTRSPLPCWQALRLPNGYLHEECLTCQVFTEAPMPGLQLRKFP